jgi:membrane-associated phospholipid phosphatase
VDIAAFDAAISAALRAAESPGLTQAMWATTLLGDTAVMVVHTAVACVLLWAWGRRREAGVMLAAMIAGPALSTALKSLLARPRPPVASALIALPGNGSLPSGHAIAGLLFYGTLALLLVADAGRGAGGRGGLAAEGGHGVSPLRAVASACLLAVGLAIGVSRVYLGVHWATDVLAGWAIAAVLLAGVWRALSLRATDTAATPDALALTAFGIVLALGAVLAEAGLAPLL